MLAALKINVWWKKYLTQLQIVQFIIDIAACVYASWHEPVLGGLGLSKFFPNAAWCNGTLIGAVSGVGIIFSYLLLFLVFYFNTVGIPLPTNPESSKPGTLKDITHFRSSTTLPLKWSTPTTAH